MDLFKAFDTINRDLLIAKLHAYRFDKSSLKLIFSYLKIDGIGERLTRILVHGKSCSKGFLMDLSLALFFSIFI